MEINCGSRGGLGRGGQKGKNGDNCNSITIQNYLKKSSHYNMSPGVRDIHLHSGILCNRKKEGALTLCNSMNGSGESIMLSEISQVVKNKTI